MKRNYENRGSTFMATALAIAMGLLWLYVQTQDYNDCIKYNFGC